MQQKLHNNISSLEKAFDKTQRTSIKKSLNKLGTEFSQSDKGIDKNSQLTLYLMVKDGKFIS